MTNFLILETNYKNGPFIFDFCCLFYVKFNQTEVFVANLLISNQALNTWYFFIIISLRSNAVNAVIARVLTKYSSIVVTRKYKNVDFHCL